MIREEVVHKAVIQEPAIRELFEDRGLGNRHRHCALTGDYKGFCECHILPDWLLICGIDQEDLILTVSRTGMHSDLF